MATITSLQARVAQLEAEVATLRLEIQTKEATILDLRRRPPVILHPFHPDPATSTFTSPDATKKGENVPTAGSGSEAREEEGAQEVTPSIVTLTAEWDDFLGTYFQDSSSTSTSSSSSSSEDTREIVKETEQQTSNVSLEPQSPSGTKSPSETAAQVTMEEVTQEEQISMEPVSPSGTEAAEDLSSSPELFVETNKESSKVIGQLEETVNAEVNSEAAAVSKGPVIIDDSSTEELSADEPIGEATGEISSGVNVTVDDKGKRKLTPEEEAQLEERRPKKIKGRPNTSLDEERARQSALLEERGYDFDEVFHWSVPRMAAELDKMQQQEQEAAASKVQIATTKTQKNKAYRDKCKAFLLEYGFHARQLGPMKNSTMDMHIRDIKAKVARGELPSIEQIRARKESLMRGLGLGGGARIEFPLSGKIIREGEEVMCGEATKAMFPKMFPLNPKEEQISPPSSPSMDNMPISSVIKIKKGKQSKRKQSTPNPDPERLSQADERRTKPSTLPITSGKHSRTSHSSWCIASLSSREIKMFTKRFLLVLALVLALTSEIRMAKELSSNHQSDLKDLIYDNDDPRYYMDALQVRWFINRRLRQTAYTLPPGIPQPRSYPLPPNVPCCGSQAKPVHKQAHEAQPHN
ncbi:hypothetical protein E3N88_18176 [Mikania micrantha]|uniref:Uncharacterized protein n=1 Tax=Mikania micrantha TaxID=192012 RepID=A0A5N6NVD2_9ASTR|nr:hypothetical protein E3N88_18176 [Mikania micrantha]